MQKQKIVSMKSDIQDCHQKVDDMCTEFEELKEQLKSSRTKLECTEKVLRNVTNQRDTAIKSRDFVKKLSKATGRYLALQEDYAGVYMENMDLSDVVTELTSKECSEEISTKDGLAYASDVQDCLKVSKLYLGCPGNRDVLRISLGYCTHYKRCVYM